MKDHTMHMVSQLTPMITDLRRLIPTEQKYQERQMTSVLSYFFGLGMRTLTPYEQMVTARGQYYADRDIRTQENRINLLRQEVNPYSREDILEIMRSGQGG